MFVTYHDRHQYQPELYAILSCQEEELTPITLLRRIIEYVSRHQLATYARDSAWLNTSNHSLRELLGIGTAERFVMWDSGQQIAGWREVLERVHNRWVVPQQN